MHKSTGTCKISRTKLDSFSWLPETTSLLIVIDFDAKNFISFYIS
ncbi:hypothetical protein HMPREF3213_03202 [Heyndrickxia coagulans]|uniref:Uncharacterized protein n=1 Tax=Heyndrickxia coagulans TaxID=1398 RepID=A0A133KDW0_HEYCO|nr:hypothetical protein HMPREF3213_03202 [Heyndrickxia coagulans]